MVVLIKCNIWGNISLWLIRFFVLPGCLWRAARLCRLRRALGQLLSLSHDKNECKSNSGFLCSSQFLHF
jgi:hypothetical protein